LLVCPRTLFWFKRVQEVQDPVCPTPVVTGESLRDPRIAPFRQRNEQGALAARRDVQDWEDENVVEKATQLNTIQNIVEERKTMKRSNSFSGKLANLSIGNSTGKKTSKISADSPDTKCRLSRSVSFSTFEREEHTFDSCIDGDLDC